MWCIVIYFVRYYILVFMEDYLGKFIFLLWYEFVFRCSFRFFSNFVCFFCIFFTLFLVFLLFEFVGFVGFVGDDLKNDKIVFCLEFVFLVVLFVVGDFLYIYMIGTKWFGVNYVFGRLFRLFFFDYSMKKGFILLFRLVFYGLRSLCINGRYRKLIFGYKEYIGCLIIEVRVIMWIKEFYILFL